MAYKSAEVTLNEHAEDAQIAARLIKIYNGCLRWREVRAEDDLWNFLITSSLAMLSGYATAVEVMKQVSTPRFDAHARFFDPWQVQTWSLEPVRRAERDQDRKGPEGRTTTRRCFTDCCGMVVT